MHESPLPICLTIGPLLPHNNEFSAQVHDTLPPPSLSHSLHILNNEFNFKLTISLSKWKCSKWNVLVSQDGLWSFFSRLKTIQFWQQINVNNVHQVSGAGIQTHDLIEHESSPIITRPGLPPLKLQSLTLFDHSLTFSATTGDQTRGSSGHCFNW